MGDGSAAVQARGQRPLSLISQEESSLCSLAFVCRVLCVLQYLVSSSDELFLSVYSHEIALTQTMLALAV